MIFSSISGIFRMFDRVFDENAQTYTLEALAASILIAAAILLVTKSAPLTPLTSSAANQQVEAQLELYGQDVLMTMAYSTDYSDDSILKAAILQWDGTKYSGVAPPPIESYNNTAMQFEYDKAKKFKGIMYDAFTSQGIAYNLEVEYFNNTFDPVDSKNMNQTRIVIRPMIYNGEPSDNAIMVTQQVVLYDNIDQSETLNLFMGDFGLNGADARIFQEIPDYDNDPESAFYNLLNVRLTAWRM